MSEACDALRIGKWSLYRLINERRLATVKIGRRRLVPSSFVSKLVEELVSQEHER